MHEYTPDCRTGSGKDIFSLRRYVEKGDLEQVRETLAALFASIPYTQTKAPFEHYFQTVIYLVFTLLGQMVHCEAHSARGRADCVVETKDYVYIFEFKVDASADEALAQIEEKKYAAPYAADKRKLFKIGVNFDSATRSLTEWKVREEN
ncbi:MAG: PD-(D/E)XK nuclease domain-containing protein [Acidaminococcaceae bacterium]|nr:PD-(D/E)XK nuclease domain-containing protein [Acidaminococcaceae bacterium]